MRSDRNHFNLSTKMWPILRTTHVYHCMYSACLLDLVFAFPTYLANFVWLAFLKTWAPRCKSAGYEDNEARAVLVPDCKSTLLSLPNFQVLLEGAWLLSDDAGPDQGLPYVPTLPANAISIPTSNAAQHQHQAMVNRDVSRRSGRPSARTPSLACGAKKFCNQREI